MKHKPDWDGWPEMVTGRWEGRPERVVKNHVKAFKILFAKILRIWFIFD
jgi:hypothetical protein